MSRNKPPSSEPPRRTRPEPDFYTLGGALSPGAESYVPRTADLQLLEALRHRDFCYVLTPRQMGKSSLMVRTARQLRAEDAQAVVIDLTQIGSGVTAEQWYVGHLLRISQDLKLKTDYLAWWSKNQHLSLVQRFSNFIEEVVLAEISANITIFIDEIDTTLNLKFSDDYFAAIRALFNKRAANPDLQRITFVLLGVASPSDLIKDSARTPFNIGTRVQLSDFNEIEALPLTIGLAPEPAAATALLKQILYWTGGHPYLTQKACRKVAEWASSTKWNRASVPLVVDDLIKELFFTDAVRNTDSNLRFVRDRVLEHEEKSRLLNLYSSIRRGDPVNDDELEPLRSTLKLSGLVKVTDGGLLKVRNLIYEHVFDEVWVSESFASQDPGGANPKPGFFDRLFGSKPAERPQETQYKYDVFISCSRRDFDWVGKFLVPALQKGGLSVFLRDQDLEAGQMLQTGLQQAMTATRSFLIVLSPAYVASSSAEFEMNTAVRLASESPNRIVIPLLLRRTELPPLISALTYIDFTRQDLWETNADRLLRRLGVSSALRPDVGVPSDYTPHYDTSIIREMLDTLDNDDLTAIAFDFFREVYDRFQPNTSKKVKLQRIIEYAEQHGQLERLVDYMARTHPHEYRRYVARL
jgi:hypothetical protein